MRNLSVLDKKYPYYVIYRANPLYLLAGRFLAAGKPLFFHIFYTLKKESALRACRAEIGAPATYSGQVYPPTAYPIALNRLEVS